MFQPYVVITRLVHKKEVHIYVQDWDHSALQEYLCKICIHTKFDGLGNEDSKNWNV